REMVDRLRWSRRSGRYGVALASALGLLCACAGAQGGTASSEQRSIAEYDLARDAFQNQRLREALDHVQKALSFDEDNADAAYLGATVLLQFCAMDVERQSSDCRFGDAEKYARQALKTNPDMRDAKNTLGVILIHQTKYDEAIAVLKPLA